ncbi:Cytochrome P450 734A6 [Apostasia shenzhenica]|uniref:Cytochrome P450 734A6 n=1 Tax=Apostasia shenzhenica TaxID=1088818 RepID=A0A2I0AE07_9ASPA|nr:Cytochrome P450 734A6 [Apostasia shenzhenica]
MIIKKLSAWRPAAVFFLPILLLLVALKALHVLWLKPKKTERLFRSQGLRGPPYRLLVGNLGEMVSMMLAASSKPMLPPFSHNIFPRALSFIHQWKKAYGSAFLLWFGPSPRLVVSSPDLIREIFVSKEEFFDRYEAHPLVRQLEGDGLVNLRGPKWGLHRKLISPIFQTENLKLLMPAVGNTMLAMLDELSAAVPPSSGEVEVDVADWFQRLTEDAVTRTTFGRSYDAGKAVFRLQARLMVFAAEAFNRVFIPGFRFLPTEKNRRRWKLDKEIRENLVGLVNSRRKEAVAGGGEAKDLLGQMIAGASDDIAVRDIVEECKTFFFAGKQTTTNLLTWTTVLLAMHPDWQDRAREELFRVCGSRDFPSSDDLPKLKMLGMIVQETLRLYPPAVATIRRAKDDVSLGRYVVPRGTEVLVPIIAVHHDAELWGPDADRFNPARFSEGASRAARHPNAFMPFGLGERTCVGRGLAVVEAKLALAVVIRSFEIRVSPNYIHAPTVLMMLYPQYGAPVIFRPISRSR